MAGSRLPLTVIGGFLGAGKTTLLHHLLRQAQGLRLAVLVNDFGAINIDAELVSSRGADAIALSNGCVCCAIGDDLSAALIRVLEADPPFDAVVVEASGVSDPWRIAQVGLADPGLALGGVVVLVDAAAVLAQSADPLLDDSLRRQVIGADWLLLNKTDLVAADELARVRAWAGALAPGVPCFETRQARLPDALWPTLVAALALTPPVAGADHPHDQDDGHGHCDDHGHGPGNGDGDGHGAGPVHRQAPAPIDHGARFETACWRPTAVLSADALRALLRAMPVGVLRLKGLLRTDAQGWAELQFAGRHGSLRRALRPPADGLAAVVAIGQRGRLPKAALAAVFDAGTHGAAAAGVQSGA